MFLLVFVSRITESCSTDFHKIRQKSGTYGPRKDMDRDLGISNDIFKLYHCEPPSSA